MSSIDRLALSSVLCASLAGAVLYADFSAGLYAPGEPGAYGRPFLLQPPPERHSR